MRIGIIGDALDTQYAGIHYYVQNLLSALLDIDSRNEYFLIRPEKGDGKFSCQEIVVPISNKPGAQIYRLLYSIPRRVRDMDIVVETAHFGPFNLPKTVKKVTVIHDLTPIMNWSWHPLHSSLGHRLFIKRIIRNADLVITNSIHTKSDIVRYANLDPDKIVAAHLGISSIFKPNRNAKITGKYGLYRDYILYQGTIEPRKNIIALIMAYEKYRDNNKEAKQQLVLAGKEGWKAKGIIDLKYTSKYSDDIILLGYVERQDMPALYSAASVFVYPSLYEGFGLPVLEAMACGAPVICSNTSSLPEIANEYALYFDPNNIDEMAHCLYKAQLHNEEFKKQQITHAQSFTWEKTANKILSGLNQLICTNTKTKE